MSKRNLKFKTETQKLLNLVIHSLYSHSDIFLRELVSNASDAIDKLRFLSLTDKKLASLSGDAENFEIRLDPDKETHSLIIRDNGIGMDEQDLMDNLGTIASSGTGRFMDNIDKNAGNLPELIGQFGVGFYSAFMVADKVTVESCKAGEEQGYRWSSDGNGTFTLEPCEKKTRGTDIILHLKEEHKKYTEEYELRSIIKKYSDFIEYPIVMEVDHYEPPKENEKEGTTTRKVETINSRKAIWMKNSEDVSEEEYKEFYRHISHDHNEPLTWSHYKVEGTTEFNALLYTPSQIPFDLYFQEEKARGMHLYVKRVFIHDDAETLLPRYLRFMKGVVDSADLPLNVSREILQQDKVLTVIKKNLVKKTLEMLLKKQQDDREAYEKFFQGMGPILKEGLATDYANKEKILDLMLFESSKTDPGKKTTLQEYLNRMADDQENILYLTGEGRAELENSPYMEKANQKNYEVLFLTDAVDEYITAHLSDYREKQFQSLADEKLNLDKEVDQKEKEARETEYKPFLDFIKEKLDEDLKEVRVSDRLVDSPVCLVADAGTVNPHMEQLMKAMNQTVPKNKRIMEININHPLIGELQKQFDNDKNNPVFDRSIPLLLDLALIAEGGKVKNPAAFNRNIADLLVKQL